MQSAQPMTPRERAAYDAGIRAAIHAAQIVAITIETAPDAHALPKRVAAEAMAAFAEGAKGLMLSAQSSASASSLEEALPGAHCYNVDRNNLPRDVATPQDAS